MKRAAHGNLIISEQDMIRHFGCSSQGPAETEADFSQEFDLTSFAHAPPLLTEERFVQGIYKITAHGHSPIKTVRLIQNRFTTLQRSIRPQ